MTNPVNSIINQNMQAGFEELVFNKYKQVTEIEECVCLLEQAGLTNPNYKSFLKNASNTLDLTKAVVTFSNEGHDEYSLLNFLELATLQEANDEEFEESEFKDLAIVLDEAGITSSGNDRFFLQLAKSPYDASTFSYCIESLHRNGLDYDTNKTLYYNFIMEGCNADLIVNNFLSIKHAYETEDQTHKTIYSQLVQQLKLSGITFNENKLFFQKFAKKDDDVVIDYDMLASAIKWLTTAGFTYKEHEDLYIWLLEAENACHLLARHFIVLSKTGVTCQKNSETYKAAVDTVRRSMQDSSLLSQTLEALDISSESDYEYYTSFLLDRIKFVTKTITSIESAGYSPLQHKKLFLQIVTLFANQEMNSLVLKRLVDKISEYARSSSHLDHAIDTIMHDVSLTEGPLNKSAATFKIERLVEKICRLKDNLDAIELSYDDALGYQIKLPGSSRVNLSLLLRNANLSHLQLKDECIDQIDTLLNTLKIQWLLPGKLSEGVKKIGPCLARVVDLYSSISYWNINRMLRGERVIEVVDRQPVLVPGSENKNLLATFLVNCLLNDAANKLKLLDLAAVQAKKVVLVRQERLTQEIITRRCANPIATSAITSFSLDPKGFFKDTSFTKTKLKGIKSPFEIRRDFSEVLVPHGEQCITAEDEYSCYISRIVRSPSTHPGNRFWSESALAHAYQHHLTKEYTKYSNAVTINQVYISRANHGLPHTYRVMLLIDQVVNYFSHHAKDPMFKTFCRSIEDSDLEWLRVAAAFSVTGRECEVHSTHNLELYYQYRTASVSHFKAFVGNKNEAMTNMIANVLYNMGNPYYQKDQEYDSSRFYHLILSAAHNLDGARCYEPNRYQESIHRFTLALTEANKAAKQGLDGLIRYNISLIKVHGDHLKSDIDASGNLLTASYFYQRPFEEVSTSLKRVFERSEMITRPQVTLPFQFTHDSQAADNELEQFPLLLDTLSLD